MLALRNPHEAYRRVDFDARIEGASPAQLVGLCYEQADAALASALFAGANGDNRAKSQAITRALSAITALQLGVRGEAGVADALRQFYGSVRRALLDSALHFDEGTIAAVRRDLADIAKAFGNAAASPANASETDS
jgi:flagellar biosynthetic protein FliS